MEIDLLRMRLPGLSDAWAAADQRSSSSDDGNQQQKNIDEANAEGYTCHAPGNTFQPKRQVKERIGELPESERIIL